MKRLLFSFLALALFVSFLPSYSSGRETVGIGRDKRKLVRRGKRLEERKKRGRTKNSRITVSKEEIKQIITDHIRESFGRNDVNIRIGEFRYREIALRTSDYTAHVKERRRKREGDTLYLTIFFDCPGERARRINVNVPVSIDSSTVKDRKAKEIFYNGGVAEEPGVRKGDRVTIVAEKNGLSVSVKGVIKRGAGNGEMVKVLNLSTKKTLEARVVDEKTVMLEF